MLFLVEFNRLLLPVRLVEQLERIIKLGQSANESRGVGCSLLLVLPGNEKEEGHV